MEAGGGGHGGGAAGWEADASLAGSSGFCQDSRACSTV